MNSFENKWLIVISFSIIGALFLGVFLKTVIKEDRSETQGVISILKKDVKKGEKSPPGPVFGKGVSVFYAATSSPFFAPGSPLEKYRSLFLDEHPAVALPPMPTEEAGKGIHLYSADLDRLRDELIKNKLIKEDEFTTIAGYDASEAFIFKVMDLQVVEGKLSLAQAEETKASLKHKYDELRAGTYFATYGFKIVNQ